MKKEVAGFIAILAIIIIIVAVVVLGPWFESSTPWYNPEESLPHLDGPAEVPGDHVNATVVGNLSLSVTGFFHTMEPHRFPSTFTFDLDVNVNSTRVTDIDDFHVVKVTIFYENATPVYTFGATPEGNSTIPAGSILIFEYENDRDMITVPWSLLRAGQIFARVLVTFDVDTAVILTTPLTLIAHAIE